MTVSTMFTEVTGVPAKANPAATLLASARAGSGEPWELGFAWRPELCPTTQVFDYCEDITDWPADEAEDLVYYRPFGMRVPYVCPLLQVRPIDTDRARRQLDAATDFLAAHELWTGEVTAVNPYETPTGSQTVNASFVHGGATIVSGSPFSSPAEALGSLDQAARAAAKGQQVFLHMSSRVAQLDPYNFRRVGDLLLTEQDSVIVQDAGYDDTQGPSGSSDTGVSWMFATGPVTARMTPIDVITDPVQTTNRADNRREIWATRFAAVTFDPCVLFAAALTLP
jgi:hypothetical protein